MHITTEIHEGVSALHQKLLLDRKNVDEALTAKKSEFRELAQKIAAAETILGQKQADAQKNTP